MAPWSRGGGREAGIFDVESFTVGGDTDSASGLIGNCRPLYSSGVVWRRWRGGRKRAIAWNTFEVPISRLAAAPATLGADSTGLPEPRSFCCYLETNVRRRDSWEESRSFGYPVFRARLSTKDPLEVLERENPVPFNSRTVKYRREFLQGCFFSLEGERRIRLIISFSQRVTEHTPGLGSGSFGYGEPGV